MVKVLICCGNGMGTSMMMVMNLERAMNQLGVEFTEFHDSVGNVQTILEQYDLVICSTAFEDILRPKIEKAYLITLNNVASKKEMKEAIEEYLNNKQ